MDDAFRTPQTQRSRYKRSVSTQKEPPVTIKRLFSNISDASTVLHIPHYNNLVQDVDPFAIGESFHIENPEIRRNNELSSVDATEELDAVIQQVIDLSSQQRLEISSLKR